MIFCLAVKTEYVPCVCSIDVLPPTFEGQTSMNRQGVVYKPIRGELQSTMHAFDQMTTWTLIKAAAQKRWSIYESDNHKFATIKYLQHAYIWVNKDSEKYCKKYELTVWIAMLWLMKGKTQNNGAFQHNKGQSHT